MTADIELRRVQIKEAQAQLEAREFARNVLQQAQQLAQDKNPGI